MSRHACEIMSHTIYPIMCRDTREQACRVPAECVYSAPLPPSGSSSSRMARAVSHMSSSMSQRVHPPPCLGEVTLVANDRPRARPALYMEASSLSTATLACFNSVVAWGNWCDKLPLTRKSDDRCSSSTCSLCVRSVSPCSTIPQPPRRQRIPGRPRREAESAYGTGSTIRLMMGADTNN